MRIQNQMAGRDIRNVEINSQQWDADLWRRLDEMEMAVQDAVDSGEVGRQDSARLQAAGQEVLAAAKDPERDRSGLLRALEVLKSLSSTVSAAAGVAEAVDKIMNTLAGP